MHSKPLARARKADYGRKTIEINPHRAANTPCIPAPLHLRESGQIVQENLSGFAAGLLNTTFSEERRRESIECVDKQWWRMEKAGDRNEKATSENESEKAKSEKVSSVWLK